MISLVDIILEMNIKPKDPYAQGYEHDVFSNEHDPNKLFKVSGGKLGKGGGNLNPAKWIKVFKAHPEIFPVVYRSNDKGAEVEKLDAVKAQKEFEEIQKYIPEENVGSFKGLLNIIASGVDRKHAEVYIREYVDYLKENKPELVKPFMQYAKLVDAAQKAVGGRVDVHAGNFGYDKQGKLKMLDI